MPNYFFYVKKNQ